MLFAVKENEQFDLICNGITLKHSSHENIFDITVDNKVFFDDHIINICKIANKKHITLIEIKSLYETKSKGDNIVILHNLSFQLFFSYLDVLLEKSTKKINAVHERSLRIILNTLLLIIRGKTPNNICRTTYIFSYDRSLQVPRWTFSWNYEWYFQVKRQYVYLRNFHIFQTENPYSLKYGLDGIPYCASQLWQQMLIDIREATVHVDLAKYLFKMSGISD